MKFLSMAVSLVVAVFALAIILGGPTPAPPMASINEPFKFVDFTDLPALQNYTAKDGAVLAYRQYQPKDVAPQGSVVLIHGSSASSNSMHVLAKAFAKGGFSAYAMDVRGHGASAPKGTIQYVGQLEDDLEAFMQAVSIKPPSTLVGFSSGGGFALRFAASDRQALFQSYLFMSPFIHQDAANAQPDNGWGHVGIPRIVAIAILSQVGITAFNDLPVVNFALDAAAKKILTPEYSYALATNFRLPNDYKSAIRKIRQPSAVLAGKDDELFQTDKLDMIFRGEGQNWPVTLLPGVGHIPLTLKPDAVLEAVNMVKQLQVK
jgi:alpha-beta hydrolase superfamily lysophospholipase